MFIFSFYHFTLNKPRVLSENLFSHCVVWVLNLSAGSQSIWRSWIASMVILALNSFVNLLLVLFIVSTKLSFKSNLSERSCFRGVL